MNFELNSEVSEGIGEPHMYFYQQSLISETYLCVTCRVV